MIQFHPLPTRETATSPRDVQSQDILEAGDLMPPPDTVGNLIPPPTLKAVGNHFPNWKLTPGAAEDLLPAPDAVEDHTLNQTVLDLKPILEKCWF